jgi:S-adenosylmethionine:tRNA ribosyltransferase-isomerase
LTAPSKWRSITTRLDPVRVSDFHFDLPEDLIAQHPPAERGSSRMLVLDRATGTLTDKLFRELPKLLQPGDLLILNDSRVLPARLFATRATDRTPPTSPKGGSPRPAGLIEILLTEQLEAPTENLWRALVKPARKLRPGDTLHFHDDSDAAEPALSAQVIASGDFGERTLRFSPHPDFFGALSRIGHMPLPPYIRRDQSSTSDTSEDRERYQTVYSTQPGSAAAPTAGLHFTPEVLAALTARGIEIAYLTLHVGLGTFQPVRVERLEDIRLHSERYTLPAATADALNRALAENRRIIAVGTTTTRTLEHIAQAHIAQAHIAQAHIGPDISQPAASNQQPATLLPHSGSTSIFLAPGHRFRILSGLLTNFHLPQSTLLMLAAAFAAPAADPDRGRRTILTAYAHAIREGYRFYSYGDCMLLL